MIKTVDKSFAGFIAENVEDAKKLDSLFKELRSKDVEVYACKIATAEEGGILQLSFSSKDFLKKGGDLEWLKK